MSDLQKNLKAAAATVAKVNPLADQLEDVAGKMEAAGVGLDGRSGHVHHLRTMAGSMRAEAALGHMPSSYSGSGLYAAQAAPAPAAAPPQKVEPYLGRLFARADVKVPAAGQRLTEEQAEALLAKCEGTTERMRMKGRLFAAGLTPGDWRA